MITIAIRAQGIEAAKWIAGRAWHLPIVPGLSVVSVDHPVYRDLGDALGLPTLGEDAYVEFRVGPGLVQHAEAMNTTTLAASAVIFADEALDGMLGRCDNLEVKVENR
jgi:hypothetical protein